MCNVVDLAPTRVQVQFWRFTNIRYEVRLMFPKKRYFGKVYRAIKNFLFGGITIQNKARPSKRFEIQPLCSI